MPLTVEANRIMFPAQRRFNAAWRVIALRRTALLRVLGLLDRSAVQGLLDPLQYFEHLTLYRHL